MLSPSRNPFSNRDDCREIPIQTEGARLFNITPAAGVTAYWRAELILNGREHVRRFASEAHARWWLAALEEPRAVPSIYDYEERASSLRSARIR